jgi:hypothetical protein
MKNIFFIFIMTSFISCGVDPVKKAPGDNLGEVLALSGDEKFNEEDIQLTKDICTAFLTKTNYLDRVIISANKELSFSIEIRKCEEEDEKDRVKLNTTAKVVSSNGTHKLVSDESELFSVVITQEHQLVSSLCKDIISETEGSSKKLKNLSGDIFVLYNIHKAKSSFCDGELNEPCISIETLAKIQDVERYEVRDTTFLRVSLDKEEVNTGVVLKRDFYTNQFCTVKDQTYFKKQSFLGYK